MRRLQLLLIGVSIALILFLSGYLLLMSLVQENPFLDDRLAAAVRDQLGIRGRHIPVNELQRLTELDASERGIESLEGIDHVPNLRRLNLGGNRISDLRPLTALSRLTALDVRDNYIADLRAVHLGSLAELPEFMELSLRNNRDSAHPEEPGSVARISDVSEIARLTNLEILDLRNNHVEIVEPLAELEALRSLDLRGNRLTENAADPLASLRRLENLNLRENDLRDISMLEQLSQLRDLNLHSNSRIVSILPLGSLTNLTTLVLRGVPINEEAGVLRELVNLEQLNVRDTGLRDLTILADLMEQGALQDRLEDDVFAKVDIRENPIGNTEAYAVLAPYWHNIAVRHPVELPE